MTSEVAPETAPTPAATAPAQEWSLYPYEEANRRQLVIHHPFGMTAVDYEEETIFGRTQARYTDHRIGIAYETRQPWGCFSVGSASARCKDFCT